MTRRLFSCVVAFSLVSAALADEAGREDLTLAASDGVSVSAFFVKGGSEKGPAVVLVHMLGRSKEDWEPIIEEYLRPATGYSYLAIDLRGHGSSIRRGDELISYRDFDAKQWKDAVKDIEAAVKYLSGRDDVDADRMALVGASIGANLAINYAATNPEVKAVALLSPGLDYRGVTAAEALVAYGARSLLMAATREDGPSSRAVSALTPSARGTKVVKIFDGNLHGTRMFGNYPLDRLLVEFLKTNLD